MKKFLTSAFTLLAAAAFITACEKDHSDVRPTAQAGTQNASTYDYIGVQHNDGLDYYLQTADFRDAEKQIEPITLQFVEKLGYDRAESEAVLHDPKVAAIINSDAPDDALRSYYKATNQTLEASYFEKMALALSANSATAEEAIAQLNQIEESVLADTHLSGDSQATLLKGLAVGKHSAQYWYDQAQLGKNSPWIIKHDAANGGGTTAARINWWKVGLSDLVGALVPGGVVGAVVGSLGSVIEQL